MPKIFISYRRDDSGGQAGRLFDHLTRSFGNDNVFMDVDDLELGENFEPALQKAVNGCDIMLAVIGRDWLDCTDPKTGGRRLDDPRDWVRIETAEALRRNISVVPVLVRGATLPPAGSLPADLSTLASRQATSISDNQWQAGVADLVRRLKAIPARKDRERAVSLLARVGLKRLVAIAAGTVVAVAAVAWLVWPTQVEVPGLVGKPLSEARLALQTVGMRLEESGVREVETLLKPPGTVVTQDPSAGRHVSAREPVSLTIAKAPPPVDLSRHVKIRDLGNEGAVTGLAAVVAIEAALGEAGRPARLSERYLYEKAKQHDELNGAEGTWLSAVVYVGEQFGAPPYEMWPYVPGQHKPPRGVIWAQLDTAASAFTAQFHRVANVDEIYAQLRKGRPVIAGVNVGPEWSNDVAMNTGRIILGSSGTREVPRGAVAFVGFDPSAGVLRFAHSWGEGWGDKGFGTMSLATARDVVIASMMWAVEAK